VLKRRKQVSIKTTSISTARDGGWEEFSCIVGGKKEVLVVGYLGDKKNMAALLKCGESEAQQVVDKREIRQQRSEKRGDREGKGGKNGGLRLTNKPKRAGGPPFGRP